MKFTFVLLLILASTCFSQDLIPYSKNKLWGFCTTEKEVVIVPKYKSVDFFHGDLAKVQSTESKKYGMIDKAGEIIIPLEYERKELGSCFQDRILFVKDKKYGYYNSKGEVVIAPQFEYAYSFFNGHALTPAKKNGKYGIISIDGETVLQFNLPPIGAISELGYMTVYTDHGNGMIDLKGNYIADTIYIEKKMHKKTQDPNLKQNFMSLRRKDGAKVNTYLFCNGEKLICYTSKNFIDLDHFDDHKYLLVSYATIGFQNGENRTRALVDVNGDPVLTWADFPFVGDYTDNAVIVGKKKGNEIFYGLINSQGKLLIKPKYEKISSFDSKGIARFKLKDKYGFINDKGEVIQHAQIYENVSSLGFMDYGLMYYSDSQGGGIMDYEGNLVFTRNDSFNYFFYDHGFIRKVDKTDKKEQLCNKNGEPITKFYEDISGKKYGFKIKEDGYFGVLDSLGKVIIEPIYDDILYSQGKGFQVLLDNKKGWLNLEGETILAVLYKDIRSIGGSNNFWIENDSYKWQLVKENGELINDNTYSELKFFTKGLYNVYKGSWGLVDRNGNEVVPLVCREPLKPHNSKNLIGVVKAGSIVYGYIGKDFTLYWD